MGRHEISAEAWERIEHLLPGRPVIPPRQGRTTPREYDRHIYKQRNLVERFIGWAKHFRRAATRYEKTARNFLAVRNFVAIVKLLK